MKAKYLIPIALGFAVATQSCSDFLETEPAESYSPDLVWGSEANIQAFVRGRYGTAMGYYKVPMQWDCYFTNNMAYSFGSMPYVLGGRSATNPHITGLNARFGFIRNCNLIIEKCKDNAALTETQQKEYVAIGKLLRAMCYYDLARKFGKFIWVDEVLIEDSNFDLPLTKSIEETYNLVLTDIRDAVKDLPTSALPGEPTRNYGYALLSEVCLTAAAYSNDAKSLQINGKSLYQEAIDAVDAITGVSLDPNYGDMFNQNSPYSNEIILATYLSAENATLGDCEMRHLVPNVPNAQLSAHSCQPLWKGQEIPFESWCQAAPTQNLVDAYLVIDEQDGLAKPWNETSQFVNNTTEISEAEALPMYSYMGVNDEGEPARIANYTYASSTEKYLKGYKVTTAGANISELMYKNRDARFYGSIIYDGTTFYNEEITCYYHGNYGRYGRDTYAGYVPITNYAGLKGVYSNVSPRYINTSFTAYHEVVSRYGRVLLNKAEAQLRLNKVADAVATFNQTRTIHGQLPPSTASTLAEAWTDYRRERRVELYFESDWYWSLLRWGCYGGEANYGNPSKGAIPELTESANFIEINQQREVAFIAELGYNNNMRLFPVPTYYLFPVDQGLIDANPAVTAADQNPGY